MKIKMLGEICEYNPMMTIAEFTEENEHIFLPSYEDYISPRSTNNGDNMDWFPEWCEENESFIIENMQECYEYWLEENK